MNVRLQKKNEVLMYLNRYIRQRNIVIKPKLIGFREKLLADQPLLPHELNTLSKLLMNNLNMNQDDVLSKYKILTTSPDDESDTEELFTSLERFF